MSACTWSGQSGINPSDDLLDFLRRLPDMDIDAYLEAASKPLPECFRINTLKLPEERVKNLLKDRGWSFVKIPWARFGYRLMSGPESGLGLSMEHMLGLIYVQGPVSMLPAEVLEPKPGTAVLDLCASPGSKSTQLAQLMNNEGILVCNDISATRIKPLVANLQRCGVINVIIVQSDGRLFRNWCKEQFDNVLVDAPCSSLGILSKDWSAANRYSEKLSRRISRLQQSLLISAYDCLKPGGLLVYSTCTIHPLENEWVVTHLLDERSDAKLLPVSGNGLKSRKPLEEWAGVKFSSEIKNCFKCYPHDNDAEGFFIAKIKKEM
ncbi:MAG: RsmB/NOP family class I SAM-dependent RNA methyltransferase [Nitrososphaerota archaeon]